MKNQLLTGDKIFHKLQSVITSVYMYLSFSLTLSPSQYKCVIITHIHTSQGITPVPQYARSPFARNTTFSTPIEHSTQNDSIHNTSQ